MSRVIHRISRNIAIPRSPTFQVEKALFKHSGVKIGLFTSLFTHFRAEALKRVNGCNRVFGLCNITNFFWSKSKKNCRKNL